MIKKIKKEIKELLPTVVTAGAVALVLNIFVGITTVQGSSMEPTLYTGNKLIINKIAKLTDNIDRGDIIVFDATPGEGKKDKIFYIKRVVGKEGDLIEIKNGDVFVNGKEIKEEYADKTNSPSNLTMTVPDDSYFVLGDNRDRSNDSRYFGTILHSQVSGKISMQIFPNLNTSKFNPSLSR